MHLWYTNASKDLVGMPLAASASGEDPLIEDGSIGVFVLHEHVDGPERTQQASVPTICEYLLESA